MKPILIAYATREGQTRHVAEHVDNYLRGRGLTTSIYDLAALANAAPLYFSDYAAVIVAASVHDRQHEPEAVAFAKRHADDINDLPCLVLSISAAQILAESARAPALLRRLAAWGAYKLLRQFLTETWLLTTSAYPVAGALAYSKYTRKQRWAFMTFAFLARLPLDSRHDHAFSDLRAVEHHVEALVEACAHHQPRAQRCGQIT